MAMAPTTVPDQSNVFVNSTNTYSNTSGSSTCLARPGPPFIVSNSTRVALVKPIFTATPYSQYIYGSFYAFYKKHAASVGNITTDLNLLNTTVTSGMNFNFGWGHSYPLYTFMKSTAARNCGLVFGKNLSLVSDINVTQGALFAQNGSARFDVVVYGFAEYLTPAEYAQLMKFVAQGGRLLIMGGDSFQVRVHYNPKNGYETYMVGHGFTYNNKTAWTSSPHILNPVLTRFIGAVDCCFRSGTYGGATLNLTNSLGSALGSTFGNVVFKSYTPHEEDSVSNLSHTSIIGVFRNSSGTLVAAFAHEYGKGAVICMCVFADDVILTDQSVQYFAMLAIGTPTSKLITSVAPSPGPRNLLIEGVFAVAVISTISVAFYLAGRKRGR